MIIKTLGKKTGHAQIAVYPEKLYIIAKKFSVKTLMQNTVYFELLLYFFDILYIIFQLRVSLTQAWQILSRLFRSLACKDL